MGHISKERYEQKKIDRLINHLRIYHEKGEPIDFEILVDGFKAVRRTSDLEMFSLYEDFIDGDTNTVEFLFYTGNSNNNHKHIFHFGETSRNEQKTEHQKEEMNGIDLDERIEEGVQKRLREEQFTVLQAENKDLQDEVKDLEKEVERLEREKTELVARQSPLNSVLGELGSSFVESLIRRNPKIIAAIPGGQALAGLIESEPSVESQPEETEVSFQSMSSSASMNGEVKVLTEEQQAAIQFVNQLKSQFIKEEFDKVLLILQTLADDKSKIDLIINHVNNLSTAA